MTSEEQDRFKPDSTLIDKLYSEVEALNSESKRKQNKLESKIPHDE